MWHSKIDGSDEPGNEYLPLIGLLVGDLEDINAIAFQNSDCRIPPVLRSGTLFDLYDYSLGCSYTSEKSASKVVLRSGTIFDFYAYSLAYSYTSGKSPSKRALDRMILDLLRSKGAEMSKPISRTEHISPSYRAQYFKTETFLLRQIPEVAERKTH